jgi:uncharacterized protein YjiS (DUF1127 family)
MAFLNTTHTVTLTDRFAALREDFETALTKRRAYSTTLNELSALSDRDLADLGLHRSGIKAVALEAARNI